VGERTLRRWLRDPAFAEAYRAARREALEQATAQLQAATCEAVETLRELLAPGVKPAVRLGAARAVLEMAYKATEWEWSARETFRREVVKLSKLSDEELLRMLGYEPPEAGECDENFDPN
jgi:hypothetical protein